MSWPDPEAMWTEVARPAVDLISLDAPESSVEHDAANRSPPPKDVRHPPVTASTGSRTRDHPPRPNVTCDESAGHLSRPIRSSANARLNSLGTGRPWFW